MLKAKVFGRFRDLNRFINLSNTLFKSLLSTVLHYRLYIKVAEKNVRKYFTLKDQLNLKKMRSPLITLNNLSKIYSEFTLLKSKKLCFP